MFLGENVHRAMPYRSLVQVLLKHPSSHKHQRTVVLGQGAPAMYMEHLPSTSISFQPNTVTQAQR